MHACISFDAVLDFMSYSLLVVLRHKLDRLASRVPVTFACFELEGALIA
jgi:hypothetical protein